MTQEFRQENALQATNHHDNSLTFTVAYNADVGVNDVYNNGGNCVMTDIGRNKLHLVNWILPVATTVVFLTTTGLTNIEIANAFKSSLVLKPIHQQRKLMVISLETFYPFIFFLFFVFERLSRSLLLTSTSLQAETMRRHGILSTIYSTFQDTSTFGTVRNDRDGTRNK